MLVVKLVIIALFWVLGFFLASLLLAFLFGYSSSKVGLLFILMLLAML